MTDDVKEVKKNGLMQRLKKLRVIDILIPIIMLGMVATLAYLDIARQPTVMTDNTACNITEIDLNHSFYEGFVYGYATLQTKIMNSTFNCQPITVNYLNYTANLIAVECLNITGGNSS